MFEWSGPLPPHLDSEKTKTSFVQWALYSNGRSITQKNRDRLLWQFNWNMAQFILKLCFRVAFLAVLLPLASGEHYIIWNLLLRCILTFITTIIGIDWIYLSVSRRLPRTIATLSLMSTESIPKRLATPGFILVVKRSS